MPPLSEPINHIWMMKVYQILDQWRLVILRAANDPTSLFFVPPYNLFVFGIPFSTLHLFVIKDKVLRRPVEAATESRRSDITFELKRARFSRVELHPLVNCMTHNHHPIVRYCNMRPIIS